MCFAEIRMNVLHTQEEEPMDLTFRTFYDLMSWRVNKILLVSSPYDAFIMEEDGRITERIIHEYRGLNLTSPPRITWVSTAGDALKKLNGEHFDLGIVMPHLDDMDPLDLCREIKANHPQLRIYVLAHDNEQFLLDQRYGNRKEILRTFVWLGNTDLLMAMIKSTEDAMNVDKDTRQAKMRVIILVEDSPLYRSSFLPLLYKEIVLQTQATLDESLNEEHRLLKMRARPKILLAETFEEAEHLYSRLQPYLFCVISDVRFRRNSVMDPEAGLKLLARIHGERPDLPTLLLSSEEDNREKAARIPSLFLNKNDPDLHGEISRFLQNRLGFGDFVFRLPNGWEVGRAPNVRTMLEALPSMPDESILYHASRHDFSTWLMARAEIDLASHLKRVKASDFSSVDDIREYLIRSLRKNRRGRQKGVITDFMADDFDPDADFAKVGKGSLGGKARGLAFFATLLVKHPELEKKYQDLYISIPKALVISTDAFDAFVRQNGLSGGLASTATDEQIEAAFVAGDVPGWLRRDLKSYLLKVHEPLAVRSSSLMEDAYSRPCAGIFKTYFIPNCHPDPDVRLAQLIHAIKKVYASTRMEAPRLFAQSSPHRTEEDRMAVIVQKITGVAQGNLYYPSLSGVAQSHNFYPIGHMKADEGVVHMALGLGKAVVEGETSLRFSPRYPQFMPQFSAVDDVLTHAQRYFYALSMQACEELDIAPLKIAVHDALDHPPVKFLTSTYIPEDHRIKDSSVQKGHPVLTFARILKYGAVPLADLLTDLLDLGRRSMGTPVEIEFALNLAFEPGQRYEFSLLQIRPMTTCQQGEGVEIRAGDRKRALCFSGNALGYGQITPVHDIVYVKPESFDPARTKEIAEEISRMNSILTREGRRFLLAGPGRWGSADRWLGIPVSWEDISSVMAIIEASLKNLEADPSQGTHFFHNIVASGISYLTVTDRGEDFMDWSWLNEQEAENETSFVRHVHLKLPVFLKLDARGSRAVIVENLWEVTD
jgi:DNA-binding NarL/FixJ family response regulator